MTSSHWAWILLVAPGACAAPDDTIDVVFDACAPLTVVASTGAARERAALGEGVSMWRQLGFPVSTIPAEGAAQLEVRFEQAPAFSRGLYEDELGIVIVNPRLDDRTLAVTLAHELGHAFGLQHVDPDVRPSVMNPASAIAPDHADAEAIATLWGECG